MHSSNGWDMQKVKDSVQRYKWVLILYNQLALFLKSIMIELILVVKPVMAVGLYDIVYLAIFLYFVWYNLFLFCILF